MQYLKVHCIAELKWWGPICNILEYVHQPLSTVKGTTAVQQYFNSQVLMDHSLFDIYIQNAFDQYSAANKYILNLVTIIYSFLICF